jgi:cytochrome c oxidase assembly factor CtaG
MRAGAVFAVGLVLLPPLASDAELLFAAHMTQHLLLIAAAAPLLAASGAFDGLARRVPGRVLVQPASSWAVFVCVFLFWHWPGAFQWAAQAEWSRLLEVALILFAACLFWTTALSPENPAAMNDGARALFVMTAAVATDLPGVIMLFAPHAICIMPGENAAAFGLSPLEDQQIAGLLMWVPANLIFFSIATWLFARWMSPSEIARSSRSGL